MNSVLNRTRCSLPLIIYLPRPCTGTHANRPLAARSVHRVNTPIYIQRLAIVNASVFMVTQQTFIMRRLSFIVLRKPILREWGW